MKRVAICLAAILLLMSAALPVLSEERVLMDSLVPIVEDKVTMTMLVNVGPNNEEPNDMWFFEYFEELTNVAWDCIAMPSSAWAEKKPIMLATGDYPDVFFGQSFSASEIMQYGSEGIFVPLNEYIDQYAPSMTEKMGMIEDSWANITCQDGSIYLMPMLNIGYNMTNIRYWINEQWLENVGLENPKTLDELYEVLIAFRDQDANGNGTADDEIPLGGAWEVVGDSPRSLILNAYGLVTDGNMDNNIALDADGNIVYIPLTDAYAEYLAYMNRLFTEGLLDPDVFAQDEMQLKAKGSQNLIGAVKFSAPFLIDPEGFKDWTVLAVARDGQTDPIVPASSKVTARGFMVTDTCEYPDVAVRWANLFYEPEYAVNIMYGPLDDPDGPGVVVEYDENGNYKGLETPGHDPDKLTLWDYYAMDHPVNTAFNFGIDDGYIFNELFPGRPKNIEEEIAYYQGQVDSGEGNLNEAYWRTANLKYAVPYATPVYPIVYPNNEQQERINEIKTPLEDYVKQMEARFITGDLALTELEAFRAELDKLGAAEYLEIHQVLGSR